MRIRKYTVEGVKNIALDAMNYIRLKKIDEFEKYIASTKKHDLFDASNSSFYEDLDLLRKLRNRIHIQNSKNQLETDEHIVFNIDRQGTAEEVLEKVLKTMSNKYSRDGDFNRYVNDFELPWNEHFILQERST